MVTFEDLKSGKVKLEFGNMDHINAIDFHAEQQRLKELEEDDEVLKTYLCEFHVTGTVEVEVDAHSRDEAEELAREDFDYEEVEWEDSDLHEIRIIGKADE